MRVLSTVLLLFVTSQGLATTIGKQVQSLVGKRLTSSLAIINKINEADELGRTALHHAIMLGKLSLVEFFIDNGANLRAADSNNLIPLQYAEQIIEQQPSVELMKIMSLVLEKTRGLNKGGVKGWRPIVWSLMAGDHARVIELRDRGADIFAGRFAWPSTGQLAGHHNAVWAAEYLEDQRAIKILAEDAPDGYFPVAVNNGYQRFVRAMIERGIDINVEDASYQTAAMRAAKAGRVKDLQMLIDHGARLDVDVLILAVYSGNPKLVEMILDHDASLAQQLEVHHAIYGPRYRLVHTRVDLNDLLEKTKTTKGGKRIVRMLEQAKAGMPSLPTTLIAKLKKIRATELRETTFGQKTIYGETTTKAYSSGDSLLKVAVHQGLEQETRQLLDYLSSTPQFLPIVKRALAKTTRGSRLEETGATSSMFLNNLAEVMSDWQPTAKDQRHLLDTLRIAMREQHHAAIEAILDNLANDGTVVYQELLRGLALANKNQNNDLAELLLQRAVIAGLDQERLIDHAGLLVNKLTTPVIKYDPNPAGRAFLRAVEQDDRQTLEQLIDHGIEMDGFPLEFIVPKLTPELLELFIDRQVIPLDVVSRQVGDAHYGILYAAANTSNFSVIDRVIALGSKLGLDGALKEVAFRGGAYLNKNKAERAEFEEKVQATMKLLIGAGAKVGATDRWGNTPLTSAIKSLQPSRVKFLLEHNGASGFIGRALAEASGTVDLLRNNKTTDMVLEAEKNLTKIKQLLVDKGLVQP